MLDKKLIRQMIKEGANVWDLMARFGRSKSSIVRDVKRCGIEVPDGFFKVPGKRAGRPKGIPMSEEQKRFFSERFSGESNPFFGKHHSDETCQRMSKNHADFTGDNNPFKRSLQDPEKAREHKERCQQIWDRRDAAYRKKFGLKLSKAISESPNMKNMYKYYKSCFLETNKAGRIFCRSSWESKFALYLDRNDEVQEFDLEPFCIKYIDESGDERYSRIDFHITFNNGQVCIVEVKPKALQCLARNAAKIVGYKKFCQDNGLRFNIVDEDSIFDEVLLDTIIQKLCSKHS